MALVLAIVCFALGWFMKKNTEKAATATSSRISDKDVVENQEALLEPPQNHSGASTQSFWCLQQMREPEEEPVAFCTQAGGKAHKSSTCHHVKGKKLLTIKMADIHEDLKCNACFRVADKESLSEARRRASGAPQEALRAQGPQEAMP